RCTMWSRIRNSGRRNLIATSRPSSTSTARCTTPKLPLPRRAPTSYFPIRNPGVTAIRIPRLFRAMGSELGGNPEVARVEPEQLADLRVLVRALEVRLPGRQLLLGADHEVDR